MNNYLVNKIDDSVQRFTKWLSDYGETSYDYQSFFVGSFGCKAKALYYKNPVLGTIMVAPMIFCEALIPSARRFFGHRQRFPIADAHYAMGFALLSHVYGEKGYHQKSLHFLNILEQTRCPGYQHFCWGYPFNWVTRNGTLTPGVPLITSTPYAYEAFSYAYQIDRDQKWLSIMRSIAEHAATDIKDFETSPDASTCAYTPNPDDRGGVINASAYRAFLLTSASIQFSEKKYQQIAERNINFVLQSQQPNGSWYYSIDGIRDFVDHFHTCFVLKALAKIEQLTGHDGCKKAIENGVKYYVENLFDKRGLPKPFSKAPRLTVYRRELYDYAECINLCVLLRGRFAELDKALFTVVNDVLERWQKPDGSFRSRKLHIGWDNVPMHRWAQAQLFRSLCYLLYQEKRNA